MLSHRRHFIGALLMSLIVGVVDRGVAQTPDSMRVFDRPMGVGIVSQPVRTSAFGFTLCLYDSLDTAVTYVHTYARDSIIRRTLRIRRVNQAAMQNDTLYCTGVPSRPVPEFLVRVPPMGQITRIPLEVPVEFGGSARRVTVVDGNVGVDSPFFGPLVYLKGDSVLRFADRKTRNADIPKGQKDVFFLHDTTHVLADQHHRIPFDSGTAPPPDEGVDHWVMGLTVSHSDVRWIDRNNILHVIDIASGLEQRASVHGEYKGGCPGRYGFLYTDTFEYYQPYDGQPIRIPRTVETQSAVDQFGVIGWGWHEGYFYLVRTVRGTGSFFDYAKVVVLRYREPIPSTSVMDEHDSVGVRQPVMAMTRTAFEHRLAELRRTSRHTTVRSMLGQKSEPSDVPTGLVLVSTDNATSCILVLPD